MLIYGPDGDYLDRAIVLIADGTCELQLERGFLREVAVAYTLHGAANDILPTKLL